jgi:hypothetical protein
MPGEPARVADIGPTAVAADATYTTGAELLVDGGLIDL